MTWLAFVFFILIVVWECAYVGFQIWRHGLRPKPPEVIWSPTWEEVESRVRQELDPWRSGKARTCASEGCTERANTAKVLYYCGSHLEEDDAKA